MSERTSSRPPSERPRAAKAEIQDQLDAFTKEHGIQSLRDRLRIGLNEAALLAYAETSEEIRKMCDGVAGSEEEGELVFNNLQDMVIDIQQHGPWDYAKELSQAKAPEIRAWYMLNASVSMGYEKEMDLNDAEFFEDVERIKANLARGQEDPEGFSEEAKSYVQERAQALIELVRFVKKKKKGKPEETVMEKVPYNAKDAEHLIPVGEGLGTFSAMAINGHRVGVTHDAEGWVFVGAQGRISDQLVESCGLKRIVKADERDPTRKLTYFLNDKGQEVVKKVHRGFLVILSRDFELATKIAEAVRDEKDAIDIAKEAVGHVRVKQTSEKKRTELGMDEEADEDDVRKAFLRLTKRGVTEKLSESKALSRPREAFYDQMHYVRALYVYLDAVDEAEKKNGRKLTPVELESVGTAVWKKMEQKVDELRYLNELLTEEDALPPESVHGIIDMAGGAGDFGLAVGTDMIAQGRDVRDIEIVDPQEGTANFMKNIIEYLPFREDLERVAHHNTGFLQDAEIKPDSLVVAKHACGTLTDDTIRLWRNSESPMLVAMTCCQDKAKDVPSPYGFSQDEWHDLCVESALTNTEVPEEPGKARDIALRKLQRGKDAMYKLDMARVEYLRRHGFAAELRTTDKFPKGDVIIARRLPDAFMDKLRELQQLEREDPRAFDVMQMRLDRMATKRGKNDREETFGPEWTEQDAKEMIRRLRPDVVVEEREGKERREAAAAKVYDQRMQALEERKAKEAEQAARAAEKLRKEALMREVFHDANGKLNLYLEKRASETGRPIPKKQFGRVAKGVNEILSSGEQNPMAVRSQIEGMLEQMGF